MLTIISTALVLALAPKLEQSPAKTILEALPIVVVLQLVQSYLICRDPFNSFLTLVLAALLTPVVTLGFVLFGAPATTHLPETFLCSAVVTKLAVQPMVARYGLEHSHWKNALSFQLPFTDVYGGLIGGILGAWLGAVPIALDWDRPWQQWPITVLLGSAAGTLVGTITGKIVSAGKEDKYGLEKQKKADKKAARLQREKIEKIKQKQQAQQAEQAKQQMQQQKKQRKVVQ